MINIFSSENKMNWLYRVPKRNIYTYRFFEELSSGYSFTFGKRDENNNFFAFEPRDCSLSKLINGTNPYNLSNEIEKMISHITYSLLAFGKAYVYIEPEYSANCASCNSDKIKLSSIKIDEVKGYVKRRINDKLIFCYKIYGNKTRNIEIQCKQLILFDIKELGYNKKYFTKIIKKIGKNDITSFSTSMIIRKVKDYDLSAHLKKSRIKELKTVKDLGWLFSHEGLSDSYILYKKIEKDKLKLQFIEYIVDKLNIGLSNFLEDKDEKGKLVAHIIEKDYEQLWKDYTAGKLTTKKLTDILYH